MSDWSSAGVPNLAYSAIVVESKSSFWTFSLSVYDNPNVQQECLGLQDDYGIDVNLLLFCVFIGAAYGVVLPDPAVREAAEAVRTWQTKVVSVLRAVRMTLKPFATEMSPVASMIATLRAQLKALELEAERIEQSTLERWASERIDSWPRARPADAIVASIRTLFAVSIQRAELPALPKSLIAAALATGNGGIETR